MWNQKYICVNCRKSFKGSGTCGCKKPEIFAISYKVRVPKITSSKARWKEFKEYSKGWAYAEHLK